MTKFSIIKALPSQTVFDIALKHYGSLQGIRFLMEDNEYDGNNIVNYSDLDGKEVRLRTGVVINKALVDYFKGREIVTR